MKILQQITAILLTTLLLTGCSNLQNTTSTAQAVHIENKRLAYKIIIFEQGFTSYLATTAKPKGYYSQNYLENKNRQYVTTWNYRASNPARYNPNIYENIIDYNSNVDYGYDVNYKLYNYFEFAKQKHHIDLR